MCTVGTQRRARVEDERDAGGEERAVRRRRAARPCARTSSPWTAETLTPPRSKTRPSASARVSPPPPPGRSQASRPKRAPPSTSSRRAQIALLEVEDELREALLERERGAGHAAAGGGLQAFTVSTRSSTFSGGVEGRRPWPRLKTWPRPPSSSERLEHALAHELPGAEEHGRVEVPLEGEGRAHQRARLGEVGAPVDRDDVGAGRREQLEVGASRRARRG